MIKTYLLTLQPLEPYFFGNEKTFSFDPKKPEDNRYFIKSDRMPLQTTVLGMLRYLLMPVKNPHYRYTAQEQQRNAAAVGGDSFSIEAQEQQFGAIEKLSPVFLLKGQAKYVRTPFDHCPNVKDQYTPMTQAIEVDMEQGKVTYFREFDAKEGIQDSFMNVADGSLVSSDKIFGSTVRVGVNKLQREKGFYKRQFACMNAGWAFGAYVRLDVDLIDEGTLQTLKAGTVAYMGQNKSAFAVRLSQEENELAAAVSQRLLQGRIYCLGDTLAEPSVYQKCTFAATMLRDYRAYTTKFVAKDQNGEYVGTVSKSASLYKLLCAGSLLIPREGEDLTDCLKKTNCRKIGFNITVPNGEDE